MKKHLKAFSILALIFVLLLSGCANETSQDVNQPAENEGIYKPGTYTAIEKGYGGDV